MTLTTQAVAAQNGSGSGVGTPTEASPISRFVALLTPFFAILTGTIAGYIAKHIPGVTLDQPQIVAFMIAASTSALTAAWKWLQGWQQHEQLVAYGKTQPVKAGPPVGS
jgi:hypothetical protein